MNSSRAMIDLSWMPKLLQLTQDIGTHTLDFMSVATEFEALLRGLYLESVVLQEKKCEETRLGSTIIKLQEDAEAKEAEYQSYRKDVLAKAEIAILQGCNPDSQEAAELLKMEILARQLREQAQNEQAQLLMLRKEIEEQVINASQTLAGSSQLSQMTSMWQAMEKHRDELFLLLADLNIQVADGSQVIGNPEESSISSLFQYVDFLRAASWLGDTHFSQSHTMQEDLISELHRKTLSLISLGAIDSSLLFSEICILLAQRKPPRQLVFASQIPTNEDLTEF